MLLKMGEYDLLDPIVFLYWKGLAIVKLSIYSLAICQAFKLSSILEQVARMQYFLRISHCFDGFHRIEVFSLLFL